MNRLLLDQEFAEMIGGASVPWTPALLSPGAWYDTSVTSSMRDTGGGSISVGEKCGYWDDLSGNARHLSTASAYFSPIYGKNIYGATLTLNGIAVMNFGSIGGSSVELRNVGYKLPTSMVAVAVCANCAAAWPSTTIDNVVRCDQTYHYRSMDTSNNYGTPRAQLRGTSGTGWLRVDGKSDTASLQDITQFGWRICGIGYNTAATYGTTTYVSYNHYMAELVIVHSYISDSDRQKLEGYLAHKWGMASRLAADHPYKATPPIA